MIEVHPRLWVGDDADAERVFPWATSKHPRYDTWVMVSAAKEPHHRALVGYAGRAAPEGPERYAARRGRHLALNWVDVEDPGWFRPEEYRLAEEMICAAQLLELDTLIHCNAGASRSPALALLWLHRCVEVWQLPLPAAEARFASLYPPYAPQAGVRGFIEAMW